MTYPIRQEFKTCTGCGMPSACKTGHDCTIKRKEREARLLEVAARELCRMRGEDPNELVGHGAKPNARGYVHSVMLYSPKWKLAAAEITAHNQRADAIAHALRATS